MARIASIPTDWLFEAYAKILRTVIECGPRNRRVLAAVGGVAAGAEALKLLLKHGTLVTIGSKRGTRYGTPLQKKQARR